MFTCALFFIVGNASKIYPLFLTPYFFRRRRGKRINVQFVMSLENKEKRFASEGNIYYKRNDARGINDARIYRNKE